MSALRVCMVAMLIAVGIAPIAAAQPRALKIAVLLGSSGRGDRSFTDAALAGIESAKKRGPLVVVERLPARPEDYASTIEELIAERPDLVIGVGFLYAEPFRLASSRHPDTRFLLLDADVPNAPALKTVTFRADEGSFLAGVAAAAESRRGAVGFVGGMDNANIQSFECGYETGIRWAAKELHRTVRGYALYIGTTPEAFSQPSEGAELARTLVTQHNVDVLYAAAGASGLGVIEGARALEVKAIGVDTDQRHVAPGVVITSMRKRLDRAVDAAIADVRAGTFRGGTVVMSLANGGVDLVVPGLLAPATQKLLDRARTALVTGREPACVKHQPPGRTWTPRRP